MFGVNLAGAEFGPTRGGVYGYDYIYPTASLDYYESKDVTLVRLPFTWERMQPKLGGALDAAELGRLKGFLDAAAAHGMKVVVDVHNYGRYDGAVIGSNAVPISAFADFWGKLAGALGNHPAIYGLGLMNEPHDLGGAKVWPTAAQAAADAIRAAGSASTIIVPGDNWSGAATWQTYNASLRVKDPLDKVVYEAHAYFDDYGHGVYRSYESEGAYPTMGVDQVQPFLDWLSANGLKGYIGEFAVPGNDPRWLPVLDNFLHKLEEAGVSSTYFAGGPWWGSEPGIIEPVGGADRPQMDVLEHYLSPSSARDLNNVLTAPGQGGTLFGYGGDDTLTGGGGPDVLWGDSGHDTISGGGGNDVVYAGTGNDTVRAGDGNDRVTGGAGNDRLYGEAGVDSLSGGLGDDVLDGGSGDDLLQGDAGNDTLSGGLDNDKLYGGTGNDQLSGDAGRDTLYGEAGVDTLRGGDGDDTLDGGAEADTLYGDGGNDVLTGGLGNDKLYGGLLNDELFGNEGDDHLDGGAGNDAVYGGAGNDWIPGGDGDDVLQGEAGDDTLGGHAGNDRVGGGDGNDAVYGDAGDDILGGHAGNDKLGGGDGQDKLYGESGVDTLFGGAGNDWLEGGTGNDVLWGEGGADRFNFNTGSGADTIMDFKGAEDRLVLNGQSVTWHDTSAGLELDLSGGGTVLIKGMTAAMFHHDWIIG